MRLDWLIANPDSPIHGTLGALEAGCVCPRCRRLKAERALLAERATLAGLMASAMVDTAEVHIAGEGMRMVELPRMGE